MAEGTSLVPEELRIEANGLEHRALCWGTSGPTVFLVHGFADAAATWDEVAPVLARKARVVAPDLRGFGRGARAPRGSYYHFPDYVADLADLVDALAPGEPITLVGHSMGGVVATLYAAAFPERVVRFANLEGLGPPAHDLPTGAMRMRTWIDGVRALTKKERGQDAARAPMSLADARRRLGIGHPRVAPEILDRKLPYLVEGVEGGVRWLFDPLHRTTAPVPFFTELFAAYARRITCPVLFVSGGHRRVPSRGRGSAARGLPVARPCRPRGRRAHAPLDPARGARERARAILRSAAVAAVLGVATAFAVAAVGRRVGRAGTVLRPGVLVEIGLPPIRMSISRTGQAA